MGASGTALRIIEDPVSFWPTLPQIPALHLEAIEALAELRAGRALCLHGESGTVVIGLGPGENPGTLEAFVLLAVASQFGAFDQSEPAVLAVARDLGAATVAFRSARRGWARRLGPEWKPRGTREFWRYVDGR